jgi:hypothetical protein
MRVHISVLAFWFVVATPAIAAVDTALVGTWKLDWPGGDMFWVVRPDGFYRLHGSGVPSRQFGKIEAANGRWSIQTVGWTDEGTYRLGDPATWIATGKIGTGTWKRVWAPSEADADSTPSSAIGACRLVTNGAVARVLYASVSGGPDPRVPDGGCMFRSNLSSLDDLSIRMRQNAGAFFQNLRRSNQSERGFVDVPGVGDQAYAQVPPSGGTIELQFLKGGAWVTIRMRLQPDARMEDLALLIELARAAAGRL